MRRLVGVVLCAAFAVAQEAVYSGPPTGVPPYQDEGSAMAPFVVDGNRAFFLADTGAGVELHVTDGTVAGTRLYLDLVTGPGSGPTRVLAMLGSHVLFESGTGSYWLTDGTTGGTSRLSQIPPIGTVLGSVNGRLLYTSDGTHALQVSGQVEQLTTVPTVLHRLNGATYLTGFNALYVTDGTSAGTSLLRSDMPNPVVSQGRFWFFNFVSPFANWTLKTFDPSTGQTSVGLMPPTFAWIWDMAPTPSGVVFHVRLPGFGLWASDGTVAGTRRLSVPFDDILSMEAWRDRTLLFAHDPVNDLQAWVTDGTEAGTHMLVNVSPDYVNPGVMVTTPQGTLLSIQHGQDTRLLFTDGTPAGTRIVSEHDSTIRDFTMLGTQLLFLETSLSNPRARMLATDAGMTASHRLLGPVPRVGPLYLRPSTAAVGGSLVFVADRTMQSRGTAASTHRIADVPSLGWSMPGASEFALVDDHLLVPTSPFFPAAELQRWDSATNQSGATGIARLTTKRIRAITHHQERAFFTDHELVITDGVTSAQSHALPQAWSSADSIVATGDHVFVTLPDLWSFDPTTATWTSIDPILSQLLGTIGNRAIYVHRGYYLLRSTDGATSESLGILAPTNTDPMVFDWNGQHWILSYDLWSTDGTAIGTHYHQPPPDVTFHDAAALDDGIYLVGRTAAHGQELWKYDGATFTRVTDLIPGFRDSVFSVATCGDRLFLAASDGTDGIEPYISDGTAAGTHRIADFMPGLTSSMPEFVRVAGEYAYFTAQTPGFGNLMSVPLGQLGVAHSERIGQGCSGRNGIPQLATPTPPRLGDPAFRFELTRGAPYAPVIFATDTATTLLQLGPCRLRCGGGLGVVFRATNGAGTSSWTQSIPNAPQLLGLHLTAQAAVLDSFAAGPGFALSTTLGCVVGTP